MRKKMYQDIKKKVFFANFFFFETHRITFFNNII